MDMDIIRPPLRIMDMDIIRPPLRIMDMDIHRPPLLFWISKKEKNGYP